MKHCPLILICDDDPNVHESIGLYLDAEGYEHISAYDGEQALKLVEERQPDLMILDLMMPRMSGIDVCRTIRLTKTLPIIMLTAKSEEIDRILGLELGADDYIVKPFSPGEVMARIRAVLRRLPAQTGSETLVIGSLAIHLPSLSVSLDGHKLSLTRKETELLYTLAASPGRVFTRDNLLTLVWGYDHVGNYRAVDSHIKRLRQKLDVYPHDFFSIATVWGTGYKFERRLP